MPQPLLGQHSRGELIAELYDRHAAGLFAYCHDQLGDPGSAADALRAVLAAVPDLEPPRAALYAAARREIYLRDVVHAPPAAGADPVAAFVERVLRDLRPHQREVLYLSGVREMDTAELSWVLDVATDTADELTVSACRRFAQSLNLALASTRVPDHLAEVFGALPVAPVRDVLVRAPWATPPAALRAMTLGSPSRTAATPPPAALQVRQLWPTAPAWPPAETGTPAAPGVFFLPDRAPAPFPDPFAAPDPEVVSTHEATTEPMPRLKDTVLTALDDVLTRPRRPRPKRPRPRGAAPLAAPAASPPPAAPSLPAPLPADVLDDPPAPPAGLSPPPEDLFRPLSPEARATRAYTDRLVAAAPRAEPAPAAPESRPAPVEPPGAPPSSGRHARTEPPLPGWPLRPEELDALQPRPAAQPGETAQPGEVAQPWAPVRSGDLLQPEEPGPAEETARPWEPSRPGDLLQPWEPARPEHLTRSGEPVRPGDLLQAGGLTAPGAGPEKATSGAAGAGRAETGQAAAPRPARAGRRARRRHQASAAGRRHRDWVWEVIGFLICVAIAMIVFFTVPTIVTP
ncbi:MULTISPECIES: RNA polymerase sigma factor [Streptosporangium]|uniref:DNA-directed RNA polymerase specialized sigma24 family protein n=1 Tax=Streptosporangium brasiliense TaxID=47480 RepID=A0ABT9R802_9ACTN|nr:hypothetical protein [Streptosporangium brasiliense]MDP9865368.1 DNA-directed RNA polymerase specialized sigma24 family protein [Streptosporangium brasiliense]